MNDTSCVPARQRRRAAERARRKQAKLARRESMTGREQFVIPLLPLMIFLITPEAIALPVGGQVVNGNVAIGAAANNTLPIKQTSGNAIVNWQAFSIGGNETVNIQQPNVNAVMLNRVLGSNASVIAGKLNANGKVFLVNPAGVLFSPGASVNVGSLVASTLGISDKDFLAGNYHFVAVPGRPGGSVVNQGSIQAAAGGTVAMLGAQVSNSGTVSAKLGTVALGAGGDITLDFAGDGLTLLKINGSAAQGLMDNSGTLAADGGQVLMSVQSADALAGTVLNQQGLVRAQSVAERNGRIVLDGGPLGVTQVSGVLDATGSAGLTGGRIDVTGRDVALLKGALVDASGATGGGRVRFGGGPAGADTDIRDAQAIWIDPAAQMRADALVSGPGGQLVAYGADTARIYGTLSAMGGPQGGNGGVIETSGHYLDTAGAQIDASALMGLAGTWKLDPFDVLIIDDATVPATPFNGMFTSSAGQTQITTGAISDALNRGVNVTISTLQTTPSGSDLGTITLEGPIEKTRGAAPVTLTLEASGSIVMDGTRDQAIPSITDQPSATLTPGPLNIILAAKGVQTQQSASITVRGLSDTAPVELWTNGGDIQIGTPLAAGQSSPPVFLTDVNIDTRVRTPPPGGIFAGPPPQSGANATAASGSVTIQGAGVTSPNSDFIATGDGVDILGTTIVTTTGTISIVGSGPVVSGATRTQGNGVLIGATTIGDGGTGLGSTIASTAGAITVQGTAATSTGAPTINSATTSVVGDGVDISGVSTISSGAGAITISGTASSSTGTFTNPMGTVAGNAVEITGPATIRTDSGAITLQGAGATSTTAVNLLVTNGTVIDGTTTISSTSGPISMQGSGAIATGTVNQLGGNGIDLSATTTITSSSSSIGINGTAASSTTTVGQFQGSGVVIDGPATISAGTSLSIVGTVPATTTSGSGTRSGDGVHLGNAGPVTLAANQLTIEGSASPANAFGFGVSIFGPVAVGARQGDARIFGSGNGDEGVSIIGGPAIPVSVTAHNGIVDLRGVTNGVALSGSSLDQIEFSPGVLVDGAQISASGAPSGVSITGSTPSTAAGFELIGTTVSTDPGGTIILRAASGSTNSSSISIDPASSIRAPAGVVVFAPASVDPSFAVTPQNSVPITLFGPSTTAGLNIDPATYQTIAPTLGTLVLGSTTQTGPITVDGTCAGNAASCAQPQRPTVVSNLTLANPGAGSLGIALSFGVSMPGHTLTLSSAGPVTDPNGIQAAGLLLAGNTSFTLTDPGNDVGRLAIVGAQNVTFSNPGSFDIGPLTAQTYDSATGTVTTIDGTNSSLSGSLLATSLNGGIALGVPGTPTNVNAGRTIDLVMEHGEFDNAGGGGPIAGNAWHVWEASWQGETRGGLDPGGARPNYYGCIYPGICSWGGTVPLDSNHFVYVAQPTLTITIGNSSRVFGTGNPAFTFTVTGLINGDTAGGVVQAGAFGTPANSTSPVGQYPVTGTFATLVGYNLAIVPGTLTVTPLPLNGQVFDRSGLQPLFTAQEQSFVYESNLGGIHVCVGSNEPILALQQPEGAADKLAVEWKRVRSRPNLNSCLVVNGQHGCDEF
ncbi:filamentous hemagglutinin N-terminal domain-containing protein [Paraburkholderia panacisoli]|uniref:Filamentous hemagglutinin N-terminal domain-containing protein n=1 Tax=Paraburkholderia panacisoli TaxID=2603818 RepID=A0A5B0GCL6_9BURK|nr:filamentous hemagglutinin N-terminal domain-containing protein [Paraburkholderia panacisoli]KAA0999699.1 filamentous hemagglutinin N-terminal domain-containing protein [Paraburkholderia panacisoli]